MELWEDIGYKKDSGSLSFGKRVILSRAPNATPSYFEDLLAPQDVIGTQSFDGTESQYKWIAQQIQRNITEDELDPDDILVIFPSAKEARSQYQDFSKHLDKYSISSILAGVTNDRDIFRIPGSISCSSIYRAKGNEAPMVYIANADYCFEGVELIKLRNILFTAITRSRAWVRICGVGSPMLGLIDEINRFISEGYVLDFRIPTRIEMERLRTINRGRSASDTKKIEDAQKGLRIFIDLVKKGEIEISQIPEASNFLKLAMRQYSEVEETDERDE